MTGRTPEAGAGHSRTGSWIDVVATTVLALAAVATAWSGYQASRWHGEQAIAFSRANASRLESTRAASHADTQAQIDVATFTQWVDAYARDETRLAAFYRKRFRAEFKPAVDAWIATEPLKNPSAPLTPFAMPQYRLEANVQAERLETAAAAAAAEANLDIQRANEYVLGVVLFSVALFFAGISSRLGTPRARAVILGVGCFVLLGTIAWMATFPINL